MKESNMQKPTVSWLVAAVWIVGAFVVGPVQAASTDTPREMVLTYQSLADVILAAKQTEANLVHSILTAAYSHAEGIYTEAKAKLESGKTARPEVEQLAALVAQLGNEGDTAVAGVRKRLLEGGHHHNAAGEQQGIYDEGFVIVTRTAKKAFLDAANRIGRLAGGSDAKALQGEWATVVAEFKKLNEGVAAKK